MPTRDSSVNSSEEADTDLQFRAMADFMPQLVWFTDRHGGTVWYNRRWYEYTGSTPEEMAGWGWIKAVHPEHADRAAEGFRRAWGAGSEWEDTYPLRRHDGKYHWFLSRAAPFRDSEGRLLRWFGTNTDIDERIEAEQLQHLLTREVSHRVKNNLALIASLLNMQAREVEGEARTALREAALRVSTVGQLHDLLWRHSAARTIDLSLLVRELCDGLQETWPVHRLVCESDPVEVPVGKAVPVALVLNELVTNAFKHAYAEGQRGEVQVRLSRTFDGGISLKVRDFGRGLPEGFSLADRQASLGMKVIAALARQLEGSIEAEDAVPGARFVLTAQAGFAGPSQKEEATEAADPW
jgi:PAS domain S-box-containing protein